MSQTRGRHDTLLSPTVKVYAKESIATVVPSAPSSGVPQTAQRNVVK
jgi:hypothetical protein